MDQMQFETIADRLKRVDGVIRDLAPTLQAEAVRVLMPYVINDSAEEDGQVGTDASDNGDRRAAGPAVDEDRIVETHASDVANDNAFLAAAILYSRYGKGPFAAKEFKQIGLEQSLVMPEQIHKTFGRVRKDGDRILRKVQEGWLITVAGEAWLRETYGVTRGSRPRAEP